MANINKFLNADQIEKLKLPDHKGHNIVWSSETIQRCLGIRSVVGRNGYEYLRKMNYPLPSYRTLCRHLQNSTFRPGIQHDVLNWLRLKLSNAKESQKLCVLLIDEMQLKSRIEFDRGLRHIVGYVSPETLPTDAAPGDDKEPATHGLVFMLRGLAASWKQTVAYLFSGASLKREPFWNFTRKVIDAAESVGFKIQAVTTDMGPANTALWNHAGIESTRSKVSSAVAHPYAADRLLYFIADPPHLLKNLWNCVLVHEVTLSPQTVQKYNLPSDVVKGFVYVSQLLDAQNSHELRLAYKLKSCHISPSQYEKMRVCFAAQFFSRSTAAAIQTCVNLEILPVEALTTVWFLNFVNDWFDAMNARHKEAAQFRGKETAGTQILLEMLHVIKDLSFDGKKTWKPIQTGIQLSTTVALQLSQEVMSTHKLQYFLTGRLSQDHVENLFSQTRGQGVMHPSCSVFRQALRLVTVAQYLQVSKGAAYEDDGCTYLVDYLKHRADGAEVDEESLLPALLTASAELELQTMEQCATQTGLDELLEVGRMECVQQTEAGSEVGQLKIRTTSTTARSPLQSIENVSQSRPLEQLEGNALYDIMGWAASKVFQKVDCEVCRSAFIADSVSDDCYSKYTVARSYGGLTHPSKELLDAAKLAEQIFMSNRDTTLQKVDVDLYITRQVLDAVNSHDFNFPACHNVLHSLFKKYIRLRINQYASTVTASNSLMKKRQYGSKTACRIMLIP